MRMDGFKAYVVILSLVVVSALFALVYMERDCYEGYYLYGPNLHKTCSGFISDE